MTHVFRPGDTFLGYTIERLLGEGGLGSVWLARHGMLDTLYAVKVLDRGVAKAKPEYVKRFVREAKLASKIRHPNLVAVHDVGYDESRDVYYLVMDYVKGDTLRMALGIGGPRPEGESAGIILQIAGVLEMSQRFGLVHRDLKPENIMITPDGTVRLLDLGVAKVSSNVDSLRTMAASVFGTPNYIAPEQAIDSSTVDMRADIYSLGVILFELLAGRRPYSGKSMADILRQLLDSAPIPDVREYAPGVSSALAQIIAKMCAKRPEDRYPGPAELIAALGAAGFRPDTARTAGFYAAEEERSAPGIAELLAASCASRGAGMNTMSDITLETQDPDMQEFLARRRRRRIVKSIVKAAAAAAVVVAVAFAAFKASAETVCVADCERDPEKDVWASADVRFAREVMNDVFRKAGVEAQDVPFGDNLLFDMDRAEIIRSVFRTPDLDKHYDFPLQPIGRMHFALYATPERAGRMLKVKITDWPSMRVGYSPVSQGRDKDCERYFTHATLSPDYVEFQTSAEAVRALEVGTIDLLFLYTPEGKRPEGLVEIVPIGSRNVYFAVRKDRRELFMRLQKAYRECYVDNIDRYDELRERLLGVPKPENRVRVAAYKRGHLFDLSPHGDRSGIVEDWLNAISSRTHWSFDYVYGTYEECLADVADGKLDLVGGLGFSPARSEKFLYPHTPIVARDARWHAVGRAQRPARPPPARGEPQRHNVRRVSDRRRAHEGLFLRRGGCMRRHRDARARQRARASHLRVSSDVHLRLAGAA